MACDLFTLLARVALITLQSSALRAHNIERAYTRFVKSAPNTNPFGFAHGMGLLSLLLLEGALPL